QSPRDAAPLSVQSGGSPRPAPTIPARPGDLPKASHAGYLGAPPRRRLSSSTDGSDRLPNGVTPVTSSLLRSPPNAAAKLYASPSSATRPGSKTLALRPQIIAAF